MADFHQANSHQANFHKPDFQRADSQLDVLFEDNHLLVINKPAGWVSQGANPGVPSVVEKITEYLKTKYHKPGNVFVGIVSRLDSQVSGVMVVARTSKAAARLTTQFAQRQPQKKYWALISSAAPLPSSGELTDELWHDDAAHLVRVSPSPRPDSKTARLEFRDLLQLGRWRCLEVNLFTGRKHQIRVQLAHSGAPIFGDQKYGSSEPFPQGIALHSRQLSFVHPVRDSVVDCVAALPWTWPAKVREAIENSAGETE